MENLNLNSRLQSNTSLLNNLGTITSANQEINSYAPGVNIPKRAPPSFSGTFVVGGNPNIPSSNGAMSIRTSTGSEIISIGTGGIVSQSTGINIRDIVFGTTNALIDNTTGTSLNIENLGNTISIAVDEGTIRLQCSGLTGALRISIGTAGSLVVTRFGGGGGTLMTLDGNTGDLLIRGTLGTGVTF